MSKPDHARLQRVVAVINGKGGVGKTSITANVTGQLGRGGLRVLACDLDVQGNLKYDFGLVGDPRDDDGKNLVDAIWHKEPLTVIREVRDNVDLVTGGRKLDMLALLSQSSAAEELPGGSVPAAFAIKLAEIADQYDLILLDCPPGNRALQEMALGATKWVLIPTKTDPAGWDGLRQVGPIVKRIRTSLNPEITYLGVVLFAHSPGSSAVMRNTRDQLEQVTGQLPLFDSFIRHSEKAAQDARLRGQLAHEMARDVKGQAKERLQALSARRTGTAVLPLPTQRLSETSSGIAEDYQNLAHEICNRIADLEQSEGKS